MSTRRSILRLLGLLPLLPVAAALPVIRADPWRAVYPWRDIYRDVADFYRYADQCGIALDIRHSAVFENKLNKPLLARYGIAEPRDVRDFQDAIAIKARIEECFHGVDPSQPGCA